jgi:adenosylmethionine-8-amino-7-oxononanoate aminotransferase
VAPACAAHLATLEICEDDGPMARAAQLQDHFANALHCCIR